MALSGAAASRFAAPHAGKPTQAQMHVDSFAAWISFILAASPPQEAAFLVFDARQAPGGPNARRELVPAYLEKRHKQRNRGAGDTWCLS